MDALAERTAELLGPGSEELARALTLLNGNYPIDALGREPRTDPAVVLRTLLTIWSRTLGAPPVAGYARTSFL